MPSVRDEGLHRVRFLCLLSCSCDVIFTVRPPMRSLVFCTRHEASAKVTKVTRHDLLPKTT